MAKISRKNLWNISPPPLTYAYFDHSVFEHQWPPAELTCFHNKVFLKLSCSLSFCAKQKALDMWMAYIDAVHQMEQVASNLNQELEVSPNIHSVEVEDLDREMNLCKV